MRPTVIVLAAGRSERFKAASGGQHKLQAHLAGKPVLAHTLAAVAATGLATHVVHPAPGLETMGDSIAAGVAATPAAGGWLLLPADLPLVQAQTIVAVARCIATGAEAARPVHQGQGGHPVGFSQAQRQKLLGCKGLGGAAAVFSGCAAVKINVNDPGCVHDVDTPEALAELAQMLKERA